MDEGGLTDMQVEVSHMFFELRASEGYVVAGGAALLASDLISRGTQDLDLFAALPVTAVTSAKEQLVEAVTARGWVVELIHDSPAFCRLVISGEDVVLVDLALDSQPRSVPAVTILGPTLAPLELAGALRRRRGPVGSGRRRGRPSVLQPMGRRADRHRLAARWG